MDMYVRMMDGLKRAPDDNPTVGIILCAHKELDRERASLAEQNRTLDN